MSARAKSNVVMWEARAAEGRLGDLIAHVHAHAAPEAQVYRGTDGSPRVVVIDPTGAGVPDVPRELLARPAHQWAFEPI
jgi:hypothetical protein